MKTLEIYLLMALKDVCSYNLDGNFDELFRDVEIENSNDAAIWAVEAPIAQEIALDAESMEGSERKHRVRLVSRAMPHCSPKSTLTR